MTRITPVYDDDDDDDDIMRLINVQLNAQQSFNSLMKKYSP